MDGGPVVSVQFAVGVVQLGAVGPDDGRSVFAVQQSSASVGVTVLDVVVAAGGMRGVRLLADVGAPLDAGRRARGGRRPRPKR